MLNKFNLSFGSSSTKIDSQMEAFSGFIRFSLNLAYLFSTDSFCSALTSGTSIFPSSLSEPSSSPKASTTSSKPSPLSRASIASLVTNSTSDNSSAFTTALATCSATSGEVITTTAALEPTTMSPLSLAPTSTESPGSNSRSASSASRTNFLVTIQFLPCLALSTSFCIAKRAFNLFKYLLIKIFPCKYICVIS